MQRNSKLYRGILKALEGSLVLEAPYCAEEWRDRLCSEVSKICYREMPWVERDPENHQGIHEDQKDLKVFTGNPMV